MTLTYTGFVSRSQNLPKLLRPSGGLVARSEERRVGKECRSRCDWSSDVCSSDLLSPLLASQNDPNIHRFREQITKSTKAFATKWRARSEIGRASCRERV